MRDPINFGLASVIAGLLIVLVVLAVMEFK
jgi:hypothetical protein